LGSRIKGAKLAIRTIYESMREPRVEGSTLRQEAAQGDYTSGLLIRGVGVRVPGRARVMTYHRYQGGLRLLQHLRGLVCRRPWAHH
jgi:hypothetical protein